MEGEGHVGQVIPGADGVVGAGDDVLEAQELGQALAMHGEACAGEGRRAQGGTVHVGVGPGQALLVLAQEGERAGQVVGKGGGLGRLGVGVAGHEGLQVGPGQGQQAAAQGQEIPGEGQETGPQGHAGQGLAQVVAAAGQLQVAAPVRPGLLDDPLLHPEEEVFHPGLVGQVLCSCCLDLGHRGQDGRRVLPADDALLRQHQRVGLVGGQHGLEELGLGVPVGGLEHVTAVDGVGKGGGHGPIPSAR